MSFQRGDAAFELVHADEAADLNTGELQQSKRAAEKLADERLHNGTEFSTADQMTSAAERTKYHCGGGV